MKVLRERLGKLPTTIALGVELELDLDLIETYDRARSSSSFGTIVSSLICLFAVVVIAFSWEDILEGLQPVQVVAQTESEQDQPVEAERPSKSEQSDNPDAYVAKPPQRSVQPRTRVREPIKQATSRTAASEPQVKPKPQTRPKPKPKPKLDLGGRKYPKAPPKTEAQPQESAPIPSGMTFYERMPNGRKVAIKPGDPRLPLLRKQWREQYQRR